MSTLAEPSSDDRLSASGSADVERLRRARQVVDDVQVQRAAGQSQSDADVIARHPELMPQLGEQLARARIISCARAQADQRLVTEVGLTDQTSQFGEAHSTSVSLQCPHCQTMVAVPTSGSWSNLSCSACGSGFRLVDDEDAATGLQPGDFVGRFELLKRLGTGGFGVVWKARDPQLDRVVALKIPRRGELTGAEAELFFREARAAAQVRHPLIVSIHEVGRDGDAIYLVSDYVDGLPLSQWREKQRPSITDSAAVCGQIAVALAQIHAAGIVHRDLKPANVIATCDADGAIRPHLTDFGLARRVAGELTMTVDGQLMGTPAYMSPEQASGGGHAAGPTSDVYSLGVILFELLTGETPFRGAPTMIIDQVLHDEPVSPRRLNALVPRDLETITLKCLEKSPGSRYQTASELHAELGRFLRGEAIHARPISAPARAWRWSKRKPVVASLLTLLVVASVFSIWQAVVASGAKDLAVTRLEGEQRARKQATDAVTNATAINELLQQMLQSANPEKAKGADYTVRKMLDDFSGQLGTEMKVPPETEAAVRATIGNAYTNMGVFDKAEAQLRMALNIRQQVFGSDHPDVADNMRDLAGHFHERGNLVEAEMRAREAVAIYRKLGLENDATVRALWVLQVSLLKQGRFSDSDEVGREGLRIARKQPKPPPDMAGCLSILGNSALAQGKTAEAESLAREAVALCRKLQGNDHVQTGWMIYLLGLVVHLQNKYDEADLLFREALAIFRKQYGASHGSLLAPLQGMARIFKYKGDKTGLEKLIAEYPVLVGWDESGMAAGDIPIEAARGRHVIYSAWIKTENVDSYAGLWCRADGPTSVLASADMANTGPSGTNDWARFTVELDVPSETVHFVFGMQMPGKGRAWFDGLEVNVDGQVFHDDQFDFDFESRDVEGFKIPKQVTYSTGIDDQTAKFGKQSFRIESVDVQGRAGANDNVEINSKLLEEYVGAYQYSPELAFTVTSEGEQLWVQVAGREKCEVFPKSPTRFSYKAVPADLEFRKDDAGRVIGLTLIQFGSELTANKID